MGCLKLAGWLARHFSPLLTPLGQQYECHCLWSAEYKHEKETGTKQLVGKVATELSSLNNGPVEGGFCSSQCHRGPLEPAFWRDPGTICVVFCLGERCFDFCVRGFCLLDV